MRLYNTNSEVSSVPDHNNLCHHYILYRGTFVKSYTLNFNILPVGGINTCLTDFIKLLQILMI